MSTSNSEEEYFVFRTPRIYRKVIINSPSEELIDRQFITFKELSQQYQSNQQDNLVNSSTMGDNNQTPLTLYQLSKNPYAQLKIPKQLDEIEETINNWERKLSLLNADENVKPIMLEEAIRKSDDLKTVARRLKPDDTYQIIKTKLLDEVKVPDFKLLHSPQKPDPMRAIAIIIRNYREGDSVMDAIAQLKNHVSIETLKHLQLNCATLDEAEDYLRKQARITRHETTSSSNNNNATSSTNDLASAIRDIQEQLKEFKLNAIATSTECTYHQRNGSTAYRCTGPGCIKYNAICYPDQDTRSYLNKQAFEIIKNAQANNGGRSRRNNHQRRYSNDNNRYNNNNNNNNDKKSDSESDDAKLLRLLLKQSDDNKESLSLTNKLEALKKLFQ